MLKYQYIKKWRIIFILQLFILFAACKNEKGCTDPHARNYDSHADDSCCCHYNAYLLFWHNINTAANLHTFTGTTILTYYLDSVKLGSMSVYNYAQHTQPCGSDSAFTATIDLGSAKSREGSFSIMGNTGITYFEGKVLLRADTCLKTRLIFKKK